MMGFLSDIWARFLRTVKWMTHPIVVFVSLQIVWVAVLVLWVIWFINQKEDLAQLAQVLGNKNIEPSYGIFFLTVGCVLLGILLVGTVLLFVFAQRQSSFLRQQKTFVSSVTHELRSPLASLQLSFETLQKPGIPDHINNRLHEMALRDIERLLRLVDRILISARLDRGIIDFGSQNQETLLIADVVKVVIEQAKYLDPDLDNRMNLQLPDGLSYDGARQALLLILGNLVENAIKYSPPKTPITIAAIEQNDQLFISVTDQGFGLTAKDRRKIFKMFHRSERMTKKAVPGTGLGLYIVKSTIKLMNGKVWAESAGVGQGSKFCILLPKQI